MQAKLIKIGNSHGLRLPKVVIKQAHLDEDLNLEVQGRSVIIRSAHSPRKGWAAAAAACGKDDQGALDDWDVTVADFDGNWS